LLSAVNVQGGVRRSVGIVQTESILEAGFEKVDWIHLAQNVILSAAQRSYPRNRPWRPIRL
jgi:hypothetical protein